MPELHGTPEQYDEAVDPGNPPRSTAGAAVVVSGMWYFLAPLVLILAVIALALFYWATGDGGSRDPMEPTTGVHEETTPGGVDPNPRLNDAQEEQEFRGGQ